MISAGKLEKNSIVINIGHGTTEIVQMKNGKITSNSIPKATEFVTSQLSTSTSQRYSYTNCEQLFAKNPTMTKRLGELLAAHICDYVGRMDIDETDEIVLSGGGSQIPGMIDTMSKILGKEITVVGNPVMSNVIGLEQKGLEIKAKYQKIENIDDKDNNNNMKKGMDAKNLNDIPHDNITTL
jgi:cell division ATPase FtsA